MGNKISYKLYIMDSLIQLLKVALFFHRKYTVYNCYRFMYNSNSQFKMYYTLYIPFVARSNIDEGRLLDTTIHF